MTDEKNEEIDYDKIRNDYLDFAARIRPLVCDTSRLLNDAMAAGRRVLFEGAQGSMLDIISYYNFTDVLQHRSQKARNRRRLTASR